MNFPEIGPMQVLMVVAVILMLSGGIALCAFGRKRKTQALQAKFGSAEYNRTIRAGGSRRQAESSLEKRAERVDNLHIQPLAPEDRVRFIDSWAKVQAGFVDGPGRAVTEADKLLGDVMSTRGYPMSDFEQRGGYLRGPPARPRQLPGGSSRRDAPDAWRGQHRRSAKGHDSFSDPV